MALTLTTNSSLPAANPTAPLAEALQSFDKILSEEQRQYYRSNFSKPDASSVIAFVSKVDADNKGRAGKCVAPRLCTFLEAIQQFSDVVGTFVSSNPTIAALVWGGVKTAILTASNIALYFDKITSLIMTVGRSCPTYKQFGLLYPGSVDLQKALCGYFSIVIRLCIKIIEVSQRSGVMQVLSPIFNPFETAFKSYQDNLDQAAKDVQMQISLASKKVAYEDAQLSEIERKENSGHRRQFSFFQSEVRSEQAKAHDWRIQAALRNATKMKAAVKANLSPMDHIKPWKMAMQQRLDSTTTWFQHDASFCKWLQDEKTSVLWCSGNLGTGKTVLVSSIVAYLHTIRRPSDNISFFFCQSEQGGSLLARNIFGSITCQLLNSYIEQANHHHLQNLYSESRNLDTEDIMTFLTSKLEHGSSNFVILDGIDECELVEVERISKAINSLYKSRSRGLKIFCAGRSDIECRLFHNSEPDYRISLAREEVDLDIERFIKITLEQRLADQELKLGDPTLIFRIVDVLQEGARGM
jgi:hypothetical protein